MRETAHQTSTEKQITQTVSHLRSLRDTLRVLRVDRDRHILSEQECGDELERELTKVPREHSSEAWITDYAQNMSPEDRKEWDDGTFPGSFSQKIDEYQIPLKSEQDAVGRRTDGIAAELDEEMGALVATLDPVNDSKLLAQIAARLEVEPFEDGGDTPQFYKTLSAALSKEMPPEKYAPDGTPIVNSDSIRESDASVQHLSASLPHEWNSVCAAYRQVQKLIEEIRWPSSKRE